MNEQLERAEILIDQNKPKQAEPFLKEALQSNLDNDYAFYLYHRIYADQDNYQKALEMIDQAIKIAPDEDFYWFHKALILFRLDDLDKAEDLTNKAIAKNPLDGLYFNLIALINFRKKDFEKALDFANRGLKLMPNNVTILNTKSLTLNALGRKEEASETIDGAIQQDPDNAFTHSNLGWSLLKEGKREEAIEHFKESLRIDPINNPAKEGLLEAIKSKYYLYALFLKYQFWLENKSQGFQWAFIIGFVVVRNVVSKLGKNYPTLETYTTPIVYLLLVAALSSWLINPVITVFLNFTKEGKWILQGTEKRKADVLTVSAGLFFAGLIGMFISNNPGFSALCVFGISMMIPLNFIWRDLKRCKRFNIYALFLGSVGLLAISLSFFRGMFFNLFTIIYFLGMIAFFWISNFWLIKEN